MKKNLFLALAVLFVMSMASCGGNAGSAETQTDSTATVLQVDDLLANADSLAGSTVTFEGVCTHTCAHGGKKMFMMGSDDTKTIRVDASEEIGSFPTEVVNSMVTVTGTLVEERIDEAAIRQMEEQYKSQTAEKHGNEGEEGGCTTEKNAHGQKELNSFQQRMDNYRQRIAERKEKEGKEYLSFYAVAGESYKIKE